MAIEVRKLTRESVEDFFTFFDRVAFADHPEWGCDCYCCFFHAESEKEWDAKTGPDNAAEARRMIEKDGLRGCIAYEDGLPVGWCHYDRKANFPGLRVFYPAAAKGDDENTGAIVCFTVAQGHRKKGVAKSMLAFACEDLRTIGCTAIEAYPNNEADSDETQYRGPLSLYLASGFSIDRAAGKLTVVLKSLV